MNDAKFTFTELNTMYSICVLIENTLFGVLLTYSTVPCTFVLDSENGWLDNQRPRPRSKMINLKLIKAFPKHFPSPVYCYYFMLIVLFGFAIFGNCLPLIYVSRCIAFYRNLYVLHNPQPS